MVFSSLSISKSIQLFRYTAVGCFLVLGIFQKTIAEEATQFSLQCPSSCERTFSIQMIQFCFNAAKYTCTWMALVGYV